MRLIGIGSEPTETTADAFVVARARLAEILFAVGIVAAARGAIHHRREHSFTQVGQQRSDIELLPHARLKILSRFFRARILQIKLFAAVGQRANQRRELERRDANAGTEARHARSAPENRGPRREETGLLLGNVVAHLLAETEKLVILDQSVEAEFGSHCFEIFVIRMCHGLGKVHVPAIGDANHRVARDHTLLKSGQRHERLDRRARFKTGRKRHLLIYDSEDASGGWIHGDNRTLLMADRVDRDLANDRIVIGSDIAFGGIGVFHHAMVRGAPHGRLRCRLRSSRECGIRPHQTREAQNRECLLESWGPSHSVLDAASCPCRSLHSL